MRNEKLFVILWQNYNIMEIYQYTTEAVELLKRLIATPSISREESTAADILADFIEKCGLPAKRIGNNILVCETLDPEKPTLLLNAHIDTVKPVSTWTRDPFSPMVEGDRLYGLGSNDCGGGLVSLLQVYRLLRGKTTPYNLVYLASCEEEVSGAGGFSLALPELPKIDVAIAARHCRERTDGHRWSGLRQERSCCPRGRHQRHLRSIGRSRMAPRLPF